jgi:hypothetical protein
MKPAAPVTRTFWGMRYDFRLSTTNEREFARIAWAGEHTRLACRCRRLGDDLLPHVNGVG